MLCKVFLNSCVHQIMCTGENAPTTLTENMGKLEARRHRQEVQ